MEYLLLYLKDLALDLVPIIPITVLLELFILRPLRKKEGAPSLFKAICSVLFMLYIVAVLEKTIEFRSLINTILQGATHIGHNINLIPFYGISQILRCEDPAFVLLNLFGNLLMFFPLGIFLPLLSRRLNSPFLIFLIALLSSATIEVSQLFTFRSTDVDDLILNTAGAMIGYLFFTVSLMIYGSLTSGAKSVTADIP